MREQPTPEVDACAKSIDQSNFEDSWKDEFEEFAWVPADFARKLERERNESADRIEKLEMALSYGKGGKALLSKFLNAVKERNELREDAKLLVELLVRQIECPAYSVEEAVEKMVLMGDAKKFINEMQ
jgi:hypothetical protein